MHYFWMRSKLMKAIKFLYPKITKISPLSAAKKYSRRYFFCQHIEKWHAFTGSFLCFQRFRLVCPLRILVSQFQPRRQMFHIPNKFMWTKSRPDKEWRQIGEWSTFTGSFLCCWHCHLVCPLRTLVSLFQQRSTVRQMFQIPNKFMWTETLFSWFQCCLLP